MSRSRRSFWLVAAYVLLIFIVSSIPSLTAPGPDFLPKDKFAHVAEYSILGALLFNTVGWSVSRSRALTFGFLLAVGASVGALDEIYQSFIPGRVMSIIDWSADVLGTALGCGIFVFTRLGRRPSQPAREGAILTGEARAE